MKLCFSFIGILFFLITSENENETDEIVGEYYSNIYSCEDMKKDLSLVNKIPEEYIYGKSPHKEEYDVMWKFNFHNNGEIEITRMFEYYCGNIAILEKGKWTKTKKNLYKISIEGLCYDQPYKQEKKYEIHKLENGNIKLKVK